MDPNVKLSRRAFLKKSWFWIGALLGASVTGLGYSHFIEPRMISVVNRTLAFRRIPVSFAGKRVIHFSDVHLDFYFGLDRMQRLIEQIQALSPDMICFTGDLYHNHVGKSGAACSMLLNRLKAPLGKWAVLGNHDYDAGVSNVEKVLVDGGFTLLTNRSAVIEQGSDRIQIAGIDDFFFGSPNYRTVFERVDLNRFTMLLAHEPDFADQTIRYPVDLQLSGHSHGGQVRLPLIGPLVLPEMARKYPQGLYRLGEGKLLLYTNRGIGMSNYPFRFLCRPEITVLTLSRLNEERP
ncbi:metallophosphoesterase [Paenibacillus humicola]|uniref:metallophosphoesterase n=1 Tax=Paenibacillus humicola TaxID=3110540 RepID=UPI00237B4C68|nr:metallophosphoesterase [Paenibacillus humicola]